LFAALDVASGVTISNCYLDRRNKGPKPFVWEADANLIVGKAARLSKRISDS
jgi:hypothetical protein